MSNCTFQYLPCYTVGPDAYERVPEVCRPYGKKAVAVGGHRALAAAKPYLEKALEGSEIEILDYVWYGGEASIENAEMVANTESYKNADMVFAFGGGKSDEQGGSVPDDPLRLKYENPSEKELSDADRALAEHSDRVDIIVSYEPPASIADFMHGGEPQTDRISAYLEEKRGKVAFGHWFFGKMHINKQIPPKFTAVFDSVIDAQTLK